MAAAVAVSGCTTEEAQNCLGVVIPSLMLQQTTWVLGCFYAHAPKPSKGCSRPFKVVSEAERSDRDCGDRYKEFMILQDGDASPRRSELYVKKDGYSMSLNVRRGSDSIVLSAVCKLG